MTKRIVARLAVIALAIITVVPLGATAAHADASIDGAGSTWSQIAVDQWRADVARQGLSINYQGVGSTSGRVFYYQDQVDFAVSEIPFTSAYRDASGTVSTNEVALAAHRPYAYLPIVAGGTSFMYHLDINGKRVTNVRFAPETIAKIFTGVITKWNDPAIVADNPQLRLPALAIRPVVRSDGSGTTAQFTAFMASQTPDTWNAFCQRQGVNINPCPSVSLWPDISATSQQFSDGVAAFVGAPYNNGAITYVEYGYAQQRGFPVASVLNKAGYYTQPTANAVAIALQGVTINADETQNLEGVYTFSDARSYPVSSYSYMIVPTTTAAPFNAAKGATLSKFILYFVCVGQQKAEQLGYSPLPKNLVQIAFNSVTKIPGHVTPPPIDQCDNPTIRGTFVTGDAPPPLPGDKVGATPPTTQPGTSNPSAPGQTNGVPSSGSVAVGIRRSSSSPTVATGSKAKASTKSARYVDAAAINSATATRPNGQLSVPDPRDPLSVLLYVAAAVLFLLAVFGPPALAIALKRRKTTWRGNGPPGGG
ncbi:MAG: phosphate transport system substrate-binding protein [Actinomycetota bacterium]|nr:phosphate transport system substrate-binding protein [Actinomycetota bacterium]